MRDKVLSKSYIRIETKSGVRGWQTLLTNFWQGDVTLSNREAEFLAASQDGQEVVYLRVFLRGFGYTQQNPTEI